MSSENQNEKSTKTPFPEDAIDLISKLLERGNACSFAHSCYSFEIVLQSIFRKFSSNLPLVANNVKSWLFVHICVMHIHHVSIKIKYWKNLNLIFFFLNQTKTLLKDLGSEKVGLKTLKIINSLLRSIGPSCPIMRSILLTYQGKITPAHWFKSLLLILMMFVCVYSVSSNALSLTTLLFKIWLYKCVINQSIDVTLLKK